MDYLLCIPDQGTNTRENCEKIHNVLARMSDTYKLRIVPEPVKNKQFPCPPYYKKYRIYKPVKERDTNGEAYLEKEEEDMILSSCKTEEEQELMKSCIYAYQYSAAIVLKSFREKEKKNKMQVRPLSERTQAARGAGAPARGGRQSEAEKPESDGTAPNRTTEERNGQRREEMVSRPGSRPLGNRERGGRPRTEENRAERDGRPQTEEGRPERGYRGRSEETGDRRSGRGPAADRTAPAPQRPFPGRERPERSAARQAGAERGRERRFPGANVKKPMERAVPAPSEPLPFRQANVSGEIPPFRGTIEAAPVQPMQRKSENYTPMERKSTQTGDQPDEP